MTEVLNPNSIDMALWLAATGLDKAVMDNYGTAK